MSISLCHIHFYAEFHIPNMILTLDTHPKLRTADYTCASLDPINGEKSPLLYFDLNQVMSNELLR